MFCAEAGSAPKSMVKSFPNVSNSSSWSAWVYFSAKLWALTWNHKWSQLQGPHFLPTHLDSFNFKCFEYIQQTEFLVDTYTPQEQCLTVQSRCDWNYGVQPQNVQDPVVKQTLQPGKCWCFNSTWQVRVHPFTNLKVLIPQRWNNLSNVQRV